MLAEAQSHDEVDPILEEYQRKQEQENIRRAS
jgi:hypothetical protein